MKGAVKKDFNLPTYSRILAHILWEIRNTVKNFSVPAGRIATLLWHAFKYILQPHGWIMEASYSSAEWVLVSLTLISLHHFFLPSECKFCLILTKPHEQGWYYIPVLTYVKSQVLLLDISKNWVSSLQYKNILLYRSFPNSSLPYLG